MTKRSFDNARVWRLGADGKPLTVKPILLASPKPHVEVGVAGVASLANGGVFVTGTVGTETSGLQVRVVTLDPSGAVVAGSEQVHGLASADESAARLVAHASGGWVVVGTRTTGSNADGLM